MSIKGKVLIDPHGRRIRKLRVSLLDACNFRCFYCMPEQAKFMSSAKWITPDEIEGICKTLCTYGLEQIRITGGEPTIRKEFRDITTRISNLPIDKVGLTTNGQHLEKELDFLKDTRCQHINISLDSLTPEGFHHITKRNVFDKVFSGILRCKEMGFNVKLNTVLMRGVNDHEVSDFIKFSAKHDIEVRFLELMKIGQACGVQDKMFIAADEVIARVEEKEQLDKVVVEHDSTSFNFTTSSGGKIGFIASESKPFCGACSRWRLSPDGFLRACLMSNKGMKIRGVDPANYGPILKEVLAMKPTGRIHHVLQDMNQIGG